MTTFLATVIGWYMVAFSLLILFKRQHVTSVMADIMAHRGQFFILAIITFISGLLVVVSHNLWVSDWPVSITIFGWVVLVGGLFRLFCSELALKIGQSFINEPMKVYTVAVALLIFGVYLLYHVYVLHV